MTSRVVTKESETSQQNLPVKRRTPASAIKVSFLVCYSVLSTMYYCAKSVYYGLFAKGNLRPKIDKLLHDWSSSLINAVKMNWRLVGELDQELLEDRRVIFMCNHSSVYDIPLSFIALPGSTRMIAKGELFKIPLLGHGMRAAEMLSVNRQNRQQAIQDLEFAKEKMQSGIRIWMFPEGTRSDDGVLRPMKKGGIRLAIDTNAIIVPVAMQDIHKVLPNKKWFKMRLHQPVTVRVGEPIDAKNFSVEERNELSELVYNSMQSLLERND